MKSKLIILCIVGLVLMIIGAKCLFIVPTDKGDAASNAYSKPEMERYLASKGLKDTTIGSPEWDYYVNVVGADTKIIYKKAVFESMKDGVFVFSILMLITASVWNFGYLFGVIINLPALLLIAGGFNGILLIPLLMFCSITWLRIKVIAFIVSRRK
jgi:hypothetical protein